MPDMYAHRDTTADRPVHDGPLSGKRIAIQPNMSVRGWPTDAGSRALEGFVALEDATVIARLRDAGAVVAGSYRTSELGFGLFGDSGAGVFLSGEADILLMTDTTGEARVAASAAGSFGFKPSFGIVSRFGLIGLVPSMECFGVLAKDPGDITAVMKVIAGRDELDPSMPDETPPDFSLADKPPEKPCTAGVIKECLHILNEKERGAFKTALASLEEKGMAIREVGLESFSLFRGVHNTIAAVEASSSAGKYDGVRYGHRCDQAKNWNDMYLLSRKEAFGTFIKSFLFQGAYFQFEKYPAFENACRIRNRLIRETLSLFDGIDVLVLPTRRPGYDAMRAVTINDTYDAFLLTLPANVTGQPSLHIPSLAAGAGPDMGLQIMGLRLDDARLLSVGTGLASITKGA